MIIPVCPRCEVSLQRRSNKGVFQYACPQCIGFSIHFGGLKKIMDPRDVRMLWERAQEASPGETKCSHCRKPMKPVFHGDSPAVELDLCERCNLVWLDTGEWGDIEKNNDPKRRPRPTHYAEYAKALLELEREKVDSAKSYRIDSSSAPSSPLKAVTAFLGLPTEEDEDRLQATPWVTWLLILLCVIISSRAFRHLDQTVAVFGHSGGQDFPWKWITLVTSFFLHGGWMHLFGNMYFLLVFGDNVEDHLGKWNYVLLLLTATIFGGIWWELFDPVSSRVPAVGASGGIAGIITYYLIRFPHRRFVMMFYFRWITIPGFVFGALFFLKEILGAMGEMSGMGGGVAHLAHLGGAFAGLLFASLWSPKRQLARMGEGRSN